MSRLLENYLPPVNEDGIVTAKPVVFGSTLSVTGVSTLAGAVVASTTLNVTGVATLTGGVSSVATLTAKSAATVPATAGAVAAGIPITLFSNGPSIYVTSDAPTHAAVKGSLCINTGGSSGSTRLYVSDGSTTWIAVTTAS